MKFLPTINVWNTGITDAILSGQLKLQCGQWITCGSGTKSRFISCDGRSINAVHGGTIKQVNERFKARLEAKRKAEKFQALVDDVRKAEKALQDFKQNEWRK